MSMRLLRIIQTGRISDSLSVASDATVCFLLSSMALKLLAMGSLRKKCKTFGCPNLHRNASGYCDECTAKYNATHIRKDERPSSTKRGYDWTWRTYAKNFLKEHPVCEICGAPATCVDHKDMTADMMMDAYGRFDMDPSHYQALCRSCNARKGRHEDKAMRAAYQADLAALSQHPEGRGSKNQAPASTAFGGDSPTHGGNR